MEKSLKIAVAGTTGLLGEALVNNIQVSQHVPIALDRAVLADKAQLKNLLGKTQPDFLICTVALPSNRLCEMFPAKALTSNLIKPLEVAEAARANLIKSIFFSSHGVFKPRNKKCVISVDEIPDSDTFYGLMKCELEKRLSELSPELFTTIRLPSLYGTRTHKGNKGLCERIISDLIQNNSIEVRGDLFDSYSNVDDVAEFLVGNLKKISQKRLIHLSNSGLTSLADFTYTAAKHLNSKSAIITKKDPLDKIYCNALETTLNDGLSMRSLEEALHDHCKSVSVKN